MKREKTEDDDAEESAHIFIDCGELRPAEKHILTRSQDIIPYKSKLLTTLSWG